MTDTPKESWRPLLRRDLARKTIQIGDRWVEVVMDPVACEYFHFSPSEFELLSLANGKRTIQQIGRSFNASLSRDSLADSVELPNATAFFEDAASNGLLMDHENSDQGLGGRSVKTLRKSKSFLSLLAIKLPGISPTRFLNHVAPVIGWMTTSRSIVILPVLACCAAFCIVIHWDVWAADISRVAAQLSTEPFSFNTLIILFAIVLAKLVHELSHAVTSERLGAPCREMGVMLLCGVPCLYVDITSSWLLTRPVDRIRVAAAGIVAEWWLAIAAVGVWLSTTPGVLHDCCAMIVLACSVSTLLINGNPLLRYDGYYVLSDWMGIANLSERSRSAVGRFFDDQSVSLSHVAEEHRHKKFLVCYGIASLIYRVLILVTLSWIMLRFFASWGMTWLALLLLAAAMTSVLRRRHSVDAPSRSRSKVAYALGAVTLLLASVPLPHWTSHPVEIAPANSRDLYVTQPGYLIESIDYGRQFQHDGELIAALRQPEIEIQLAKIRTQREVLRTRIEVSQVTRLHDSADDPNPASTIKMLQAALAETEDRIRLLEKQQSQAKFLGQKGKKVYHAPDTAPIERLGETRGFVAGQYVGVGTRLGRVGDRHDRVAVAEISDGSAFEIQSGCPAELRLPDQTDRAIRGQVTDVSFVRKTDAASPPNDGDHRYRVVIDVDVPESTELAPQRQAKALIRLPNQSILQKLLRFIRVQFG